MRWVTVATRQLIGRALDWATLVACGWEADRPQDGQLRLGSRYCLAGTHQQYGFTALGRSECRSPSTSWADGGPLIALHRITFSDRGGLNARIATLDGGVYAYATTHLEAVCRAVVLFKLGEQVEVPDTLLDDDHYEPQAPARHPDDVDVHLKPHQFGELVNSLREVAKQYHDTEQLRAQIVTALRKGLRSTLRSSTGQIEALAASQRIHSEGTGMARLGNGAWVPAQSLDAALALCRELHQQAVHNEHWAQDAERRAQEAEEAIGQLKPRPPKCR